MESIDNFLYPFKGSYTFLFIAISVGLVLSYIDTVISDKEKDSIDYIKESIIYASIGILAVYISTLKVKVEPRFTGPPTF
jgi:hypothetical protein